MLSEASVDRAKELESLGIGGGSGRLDGTNNNENFQLGGTSDNEEDSELGGTSGVIGD